MGAIPPAGSGILCVTLRAVGQSHFTIPAAGSGIAVFNSETNKWLSRHHLVSRQWNFEVNTLLATERHVVMPQAGSGIKYWVIAMTVTIRVVKALYNRQWNKNTRIRILSLLCWNRFPTALMANNRQWNCFQVRARAFVAIYRVAFRRQWNQRSIPLRILKQKNL
jgi:hypothetical protein